MKKIKTLGIAAAVVLVLVLGVFAILAALGILRIETDENGKSEVIFTPVEEKNSALEWQTVETSGDITATIKTELGDIVIKLGEGAAAEKFISLDNAGAFDSSEFVTLAENMFIQASASEENFEAEQTEYGCFYGSVGFALDGEKASPSFFIITASELSGTSKAYLSSNIADEERAALYEKFGGMPEYEGKVLIFGQVTSGMEVAKAIAVGENSGYTGGYSAAEPVKILSVEISYPTEAAED